jgi:phosphoenolpyruvate carboxylase
MDTVKFLKKNKEAAKQVIREYFNNFLEDGKFDVESYNDSAMEGEMVSEINSQFFGDDEGVMVGNDAAYDYVDELADKVLEEPGFELMKEYFNEAN